MRKLGLVKKLLSDTEGEPVGAGEPCGWLPRKSISAMAELLMDSVSGPFSLKPRRELRTLSIMRWWSGWNVPGRAMAALPPRSFMLSVVSKLESHSTKPYSIAANFEVTGGASGGAVGAGGTAAMGGAGGGAGGAGGATSTRGES